MLGNGAAPESADRREHPVVIGAIGGARRGQRRLGMRETWNGHHGDGWHPWLVRPVAAGIHGLRVIAQLVRCGSRVIAGGERRRAKFAAADGIAAQLEPSAEWGQRRKIGMACPAGLSGLAREARQRLRRRSEACRCKARKKNGSDGDEFELPHREKKMTAISPHRQTSKLVAAISVRAQRVQICDGRSKISN